MAGIFNYSAQLKYFKGDIIEIINITVIRNNHIEVGMRYRIIDFLDKHHPDDHYTQIETGFLGLFSTELVNPSQIFLYRRPFKNWLKYILKWA